MTNFRIDSSKNLSGKAAGIVGAFVALEKIYDLGEKIVEKYQESHKYTISINSTSSLYSDARHWVAAHQKDKIKSLEADVPRSNDDEIRNVRYIFSGDEKQEFMLEGHKIKVYLEDKDGPSAREQALQRMGRTSATLTFEASSRKGQEACQHLINDINKNKKARELLMFLNASYGWEESKRKPSRIMNSVILPYGVKEKLIEDIDTFLNSEKQYNELGIPWHRGYLLSGIPGSGKTSLAEAIATHFALNIYFVSLSSIKKDSDLAELFSDIPPKSVILIEDIDTVSISKKRETAGDNEKGEGVTLGGLLNCIDGVLRASGTICIMTTNHENYLDPALIRPGRVDLTVEFDYINDEHLLRIVHHMSKDTTISLPPLEGAKITSSQIIDIFRRNFSLDGNDQSISEIIDFITTQKELTVDASLAQG